MASLVEGGKAAITSNRPVWRPMLVISASSAPLRTPTIFPAKASFFASSNFGLDIARSHSTHQRLRGLDVCGIADETQPVAGFGLGVRGRSRHQPAVALEHVQ